MIAVFVTKPADPTVIWTSDNESVATVDENGIVKFIGEGTAIITAQSKTNKTLKDTVTITVTKAVATPTPKPANPTRNLQRTVNHHKDYVKSIYRRL